MELVFVKDPSKELACFPLDKDFKTAEMICLYEMISVLSCTKNF